MPDQVKPGWKTTEFWMAAAAHVGGMAALFGYLPTDNVDLLKGGVGQIAGGIMAVGSAAGYAISRGLSKLRK